MNPQNQKKFNWKEFNQEHPKTKAYIFFGFYIIFFALVFLMFSNLKEYDAPSSSENDPSVLPFSYEIEKIKQDNFKFIYTIQENEAVIEYIGERNQLKEKFTLLENDEIKEYYKENDLYYLLPEKEPVENPYRYLEFLDIKEIHRLLKNSTYISKTEYQNKEAVYEYQLSTTSMLSLLKGEEVDLMDEPNKFQLTIKDGEVEKVTLDLSSYISYLDRENKTLQITLEYSNFGEIKDLTFAEK